jgi:hypothetical protein
MINRFVLLVLVCLPAMLISACGGSDSSSGVTSNSVLYGKSATNFAQYVQNYPDLLVAYNAGTGQSIEAWGQSHYCASGKAEGRAYSGSVDCSSTTTSDCDMSTTPSTGTVASEQMDSGYNHMRRPCVTPSSNSVASSSDSVASSTTTSNCDMSSAPSTNSAIGIMRRPCVTPSSNSVASSSGSYEGYVDKYPDLLAAYNASGGGQSKSAFGQAHYASSGQKEGRTLAGSSASTTNTNSSSSASTPISTISVIEASSPTPTALAQCESKKHYTLYQGQCIAQWDICRKKGYSRWSETFGCQTRQDASPCPSGASRYVYNDAMHGCDQKNFSGCVAKRNNYWGPYFDCPRGWFGRGGGGFPSGSGSTTGSSSSGNSSSSSGTTYCTDASVSWPNMVRVGSTITVSWSLRPSGCTVRNNSSVAPSASNYAGSSSGSSASVSSGSTSLSLPCSGGIDTTPHIGNSRNRMNFDFSGLGAALGNGKSYSSYAQMTGRC